LTCHVKGWNKLSTGWDGFYGQEMYLESNNGREKVVRDNDRVPSFLLLVVTIPGQNSDNFYHDPWFK
jgi:hypothetical protein